VIDLARVSAWLGEPLVVESAATTGSSSTTLFVRVGDGKFSRTERAFDYGKFTLKDESQCLSNDFRLIND